MAGMSVDMERNVTGMDELLAGYAAGTLASPTHALVGAHLELSGANRGFVTSLETLAGQVLEETAPVSLSNRDAALEAIFSSAPSDPISVQTANAANDDVDLPQSLKSIVDGPLESLPWKTLLPGVREVKFGEIDGCNVNLLWVRRGRAMPSHTHDGTELTLVLKGGFKDADGHYVRGDIAFADHDVDHSPVADDDGEDCICFAVTEGRLHLTGLVGRFLNPFVRN